MLCAANNGHCSAVYDTRPMLSGTAVCAPLAPTAEAATDAPPAAATEADGGPPHPTAIALTRTAASPMGRRTPIFSSRTRLRPLYAARAFAARSLTEVD